MERQEPTSERLEKLRLAAKGYPVRITTSGGKFFYTQPAIGPFMHLQSISMFPTLPTAIEFAIREVETRSQRYYAL